MRILNKHKGHIGVNADPRAEAYDLRAQIGYRLRVANQIAIELFAEILGSQTGELKITTGQFAALSTLWESPGMAQTELAQVTSMDLPTLNGVLKRLVARGLVDVMVSPDDKRFRVISLTDSGRDITRLLRSQGHIVSEKILEPLPPDDATQLLTLLDRLIQAHRGR
jgi:DNA-binding MarR family transcriptional regulator